jgi:Fibronectin type III domain
VNVWRRPILFVAPLVISTTLLASPSSANDASIPTISVASTSETSTTITLNFSVTTQSNIVQYQAYIRLPGSAPINAIVYDPRIHSITITGLTPSTTYDVELDAICTVPQFGDVVTAYATVATLPPGTPPPPPTTTLPPLPPPRVSPKIVSMKPTTTTVTVRWLPVTIPMDKYIITTSLGGRVVHTTTAKSSASAAIVRGLRPDTHYKILLTADLEQGSTKTSSGVTTK